MKNNIIENVEYLVDNSIYNKDNFCCNYPNIVKKMLGYRIDLLPDRKKLLVFPRVFEVSFDYEEQKSILNSKHVMVDMDSRLISVGVVATNNVAGFIEYSDKSDDVKESLAIHSRFPVKDKNGDLSYREDYFLYYMLEKVFDVNLESFERSATMKQRIYNFLVYLYPKYLEKALQKGLLQEYKYFMVDNKSDKTENRNSYSVKELTCGHDFIHLIKHTIEFIKNIAGEGYSSFINDVLSEESIELFMSSTKNYGDKDASDVFEAVLQDGTTDDFCSEYIDLFKLSLYILNDGKEKIYKNDEDIYGVLFDISWLWEEYIYTILSVKVPELKLLHPENKLNKNAVFLLQDIADNEFKTQPAYPDFYSEDCRIVLDAKYEFQNENDKDMPNDDLYQIISYAHVLSSKSTGIIYPSRTISNLKVIGETNTKVADPISVFKLGLYIPDDVDNYDDFRKAIGKSEDVFKRTLEDYVLD